MKFCTGCGAQLQDDAAFCPNCGTKMETPNQNAQQNAQQNYQSAPQVTYVDPFDHTAEFDPRDISDNKVYCMALYLLGVVGVIVALLAANSSKYVAFHLRQVLKILVFQSLVTVVTVLLFWTIIVPIAAGILSIALGVIQIICFFQVCAGKAKEPAIIRSLGFMK